MKYNPRSGLASQALVITLAIIFIVGIGAIYYAFPKSVQAPPEQIFCTQEAKLCPDGSTVGRTGPNCEFAECPNAKIDTSNWKIYRNEKMNFRFKYPSDWFIQNEAADSLRLASVPKEQNDLVMGIPKPYGLWVDVVKSATFNYSDQVFTKHSYSTSLAREKPRNPAFIDVLEKNYYWNGLLIGLTLYNEDPSRDDHEARLEEIVNTFELIK